MSGALPELTRDEFAQRLQAGDQAMESEILDRLWAHYGELRRWNRRLSLIGPGTHEDLVERHYGESLAGLELLEPGDRVIVDVGSGAGFPGWVMAAACPNLEMTLIESRERKWSFLSRVSQKAALPCICLNARVAAALPEGFPPQVDLVLMRAVRLGEKELLTLISGLSRDGRFLVWSGKQAPMEIPGMIAGRRVPIEGSLSREIVEWVQEDPRRAAN